MITYMTLAKKHDLNRPVRDFALPVETVVRANQTIQQALDSLRSRKIEHKVIYFYVVDDQRRLVGVIPTRTLLLSDPSRNVRDVMETAVALASESTTLEEAMELFAIYRLLALPVVDGQGRLTGHIDIDLYTDEAVDVSESERAAELFQLMGLSLQEVRRPTAWSGYVMRMPWLLCNIVGGVACAAIASMYGRLLSNMLIVAMFIPLVLTLSESISMQSMTLSLHQLRLSTAAWRGLWRRSSAEWKTMLMIGASCGALAALAVSFLTPDFHAVGAIGVSIALSMATAATLGAGVPILLHILRLDPKVAAGPVVLMIGDIITTALYLALAAWWLL